ncbi:MAG: hemolysin family protein [Lachnospirales bacterium]
MDEGSYQIILLVVLVFLSMFFSASETALTALTPIRLRNMMEDGVKGAKMVLKIKEDQKKLLTTILIGNNIVNIGASSLATSIALSNAEDNNSVVLLVTVILTVIILLFGEITPKTIAAQNCERISILVAPFIEICIFIFTPIAYILNVISGIFIRLFSGDPDRESPLVTESEIITMVNVGQEEGVLEENEQKMIYNVFEFGDSTVEDIMTPRTDVIAISEEFSYEEILKVYDENKFSRLPVYSETVDNIIGILYLKDFIFENNAKDFTVKKYLREAFFTYEIKPVKELFEEMRSKRVYMAIVIDEYGGTEGIVTLEDLVEEIVGEILDENDEIDYTVEKINENEFLVTGGMKISDIKEELDIDLESKDFDTIAGYLIDIGEKIPEENDVIEDEFYRFKVESVDKNRVEKVRIFTKTRLEDAYNE